MSAPQDRSGEAKNSLSKTKKVTPRALVRKQVENEDFHVTDEDMANLDTTIESIEYEIKEFIKQRDDSDEDATAIPYDKSGE